MDKRIKIADKRWLSKIRFKVHRACKQLEKNSKLGDIPIVGGQLLHLAKMALAGCIIAREKRIRKVIAASKIKKEESQHQYKFC